MHISILFLEFLSIFALENAVCLLSNSFIKLCLLTSHYFSYRRSRLRRKGRYYPLKSDDKDESKEEIMMISKGNGGICFVPFGFNSTNFSC